MQRKHFYLIFVIVLILNITKSSAGELPHQFSLAMYEKSNAQQFQQNDQFVLAAEHYVKAVKLGLSKKYGLWKAVDMYVNAEAYDEALFIMKNMAINGATEFNYFQSLADKYPEDNKDFLFILERVKQNAKQLESGKQGKEGQIFTQDVKHFFSAFDQAKKAKTLSQKRTIYEQVYFNHASKGMIDYASMKIGSIESFVNYVEDNRAYYEDVRSASNKINDLIPAAKAAMSKMKYHYPSAASSDIYFVVGMHTSAGTASDNGILLGADFIADSKDNIANLDDWTHAYITDAEDKVWVVVHEYVHVLQNTDHDTVLGNALVEGGSDFLANLLYAPLKKPSAYTQFGLINETMIKAQFSAQLDSTDISLWTGNNGQSLPDNWVADLGYFIGHQIAQAYYNQAVDKSQAVRDLLALKDPKQILAQSGYFEADTRSEKTHQN